MLLLIVTVNSATIVDACSESRGCSDVSVATNNSACAVLLDQYKSTSSPLLAFIPNQLSNLEINQLLVFPNLLKIKT
jgi:hypothetical protein